MGEDVAILASILTTPLVPTPTAGVSGSLPDPATIAIFWTFNKQVEATS
jgi:hypothetical protein